MDKIEEIKKITFPIKDNLFDFEKKLKDLINAEDFFLKDEITNFLFSKPKRLRPIITFLIANILNIKNTAVINIALTQELIHCASLLHDDIIDDEAKRRDNDTINYKYNSKIALLEGDFLLSLALCTLSECDYEIIKIFAKNIKKTIKGELLQNSNSYKITDEKTYYDKTLDKTGSLFFAGLNSLYVLANASNNIKNNLSAFLKNYTLAFQIKNDLDDIKKEKFSDIKNGNYTLAVIYLSLNEKVEDLKNADFKKYLIQADKKTDDLLKEALFNLEKIEDSIYKKSLIELIKYTLKGE